MRKKNKKPSTGEPKPLPPSFPMEQEEEANRVSGKEHVDRRVKEFLRSKGFDIPQETDSDSMGITARPFQIVWRPNNYRRQTSMKIVVDSGVDSGLDKIRRLFKKVKVTKKKVAYVRDYDRVVLQVGRKTLTGIWAQPLIHGVKEHIFLKRDSIVELEAALLKRVEEIRNLIDSAMLDFLEKMGLAKQGESIEWSRYEDFIKGEEYIDKIPAEVVIHDTVFKKVYKGGLEFTKSDREAPGVRIKNYIKNRALEDISPELVQELRLLREELHPAEQIMLKVNKFPEDFFSEEVQGLLKKCTGRERVELTEWSFMRFGLSTDIMPARWVRVKRFVRWVCGRCKTTNVPGKVKCRGCGEGNRPRGEMGL